VNVPSTSIGTLAIYYEGLTDSVSWVKPFLNVSLGWSLHPDMVVRRTSVQGSDGRALQ